MTATMVVERERFVFRWTDGASGVVRRRDIPTRESARLVADDLHAEMQAGKVRDVIVEREYTLPPSYLVRSRDVVRGFSERRCATKVEADRLAADLQADRYVDNVSVRPERAVPKKDSATLVAWLERDRGER